MERAKNEVKENKFSEIFQFKESLENVVNNKYKNDVLSIIDDMKKRDKLGVHAHHIFPEHEYPDLAATKEKILFI